MSTVLLPEPYPVEHFWFILLLHLTFSYSIGVGLETLHICDKHSSSDGAAAASAQEETHHVDTGHSPGFISRSRSFGSSGGCNRRFLRQQRAGYVYSWPGARPVDRHNVKIKGYRPEWTLPLPRPNFVIHSERQLKPREGKELVSVTC